MVDNGGTPDGCHTEAFDSFKQLLKHNLEAHRGLKHRCQLKITKLNYICIAPKFTLNLLTINVTSVSIPLFH